jgi:hypothetical protein
MGSKLQLFMKLVFFFLLLCSHFGAVISFLIILQTVGLLGRVISSSQGLYPNTGEHKHRINAYTHQTSMPCVGFEPTIPAPHQWYLHLIVVVGFESP